jgi:hypothetical protein
MVFDPARSNLSQPDRLHYAIAALPKTAFLILQPFFHSPAAARLIVARLPFVRECLSWVINGSGPTSAACPLWPR